MSDRITVLVIDDDRSHRLVVRMGFERSDLEVTMLEAQDLTSGLQRLQDNRVDCVILDFRLGGEDGLELLRTFRRKEAADPESGGLPIILLTGRGDETIAVEAMKAGATDYIPKFELSPHRLTSAIRTGIEIHKQRAEAAKAHAALRRANEELERRVRTRTAELERANDELRRRNAELDEFAYVASHDLQEPLRKLVAFSEILPTDCGGALPAAAMEDLSFIIDAAKRMQRLVRDLLALSRAGNAPLTTQRVSLDDCADAAIEALSATIQQQGATIARDDLPEVLGDPTLLTQIYQNLISNALKFKGPAPPRIRLTVEEREGGWILGVLDNGIGIEAAYLEQVFHPFKRLHGREEYEGTGIGLTIFRKAVERHGGRVWVESQPGKGSQFRFTLPKPGQNHQPSEALPCPIEVESLASSC